MGFKRREKTAESYAREECELLGVERLVNMTARDIHDSIFDRTGVSVGVSTIFRIRREYAGARSPGRGKPYNGFNRRAIK